MSPKQRPVSILLALAFLATAFLFGVLAGGVWASVKSHCAAGSDVR